MNYFEKYETEIYKVIRSLFFLFVVLSPFFYLPHLLGGDSHIYGYVVRRELKLMAVARDVLLLVLSLSAIFFKVMKKEKITKLPTLYWIYIITVIIRLLLNGFSISMLQSFSVDSMYLLSIVVPLGFISVNWSMSNILKIKKLLKLTMIPILLFLFWEMAHPNLSIWLRFGRYRSTMFSPTVLGEFGAIMLIVSLVDVILIPKDKYKNLGSVFVSGFIVLASGSRTSFLVVFATITVLFFTSKISVRKKFQSMGGFFLIIICGILVLRLFGLDITTLRVFSINIGGDMRVPALISQLNEMTVSTLLIGTPPSDQGPIDISWFVFLQRLGLFGFISFFSLNIVVIINLVKISNKLSVIKNSMNREVAIFMFILVFASFSYLFTTNLMNSFPLNVYYWLGLGYGISQIPMSHSSTLDKIPVGFFRNNFRKKKTKY